MRQILDNTAKIVQGLPIDWQKSKITFDCTASVTGYPKSFGYHGKRITFYLPVLLECNLSVSVSLSLCLSLLVGAHFNVALYM